MKVGRPLKFETPEIMQKLIDDYFEDCDAKGEIYTVVGLAMALDTDRQTLIRYNERDEFSDTIKKAKQRVENQMVSRALKGEYNSAVSIFLMKNNFGYQDKVDVRIDNEEDDPITIAMKGITK